MTISKMGFLGNTLTIIGAFLLAISITSSTSISNPGSPFYVKDESRLYSYGAGIILVIFGVIINSKDNL